MHNAGCARLMLHARGIANAKLAKSSPLKEMRLSVQHPIVQTPLVRLVEQQVEVLQRLSQPERLLRILQNHSSQHTFNKLKNKTRKQEDIP